jgi:hypothetical protein
VISATTRSWTPDPLTAGGGFRMPAIDPYHSTAIKAPGVVACRLYMQLGKLSPLGAFLGIVIELLKSRIHQSRLNAAV